MKGVKNKLIGVIIVDVLMYNWHILCNDQTDLAWRIYDIGQSVTTAAYIYLIYLLVRATQSGWTVRLAFGWLCFAGADIADEIFFKNVATDELEYWTLLVFILAMWYHATKKE